MLLSEAIRDCRDYAQHELGDSSRTVNNYAAAQRAFPTRRFTLNVIRRHSYCGPRDLTGQGSQW